MPDRPGESHGEAALSALGDPTRRAVLRTVADRGPLTATQLAADAAISRQAIAKHLGVLQDAGLVSAERVGREARYALVPGALDPATEWLRRVGTSWDRRLERLRTHLDHDGG